MRSELLEPSPELADVYLLLFFNRCVLEFLFTRLTGDG